MHARILLALLLGCASLPAAVKLPAILSDHMLLQRDRPVRIWGKADPGESVRVQLAGQNLSTVADSDGRWQVTLSPLRPGRPLEMRVEGQNVLTVRDILVGDVWVGSGQSNMEWPLRRADRADEEIAAARFPEIRIFKVALKTSTVPLDDVEGSWSAVTPESVGGFSAVQYFFGRDLHQHLKVPMGLLETSWGGTPAEAWTSLSAMAAEPALSSVFVNWARAVESFPLASERFEKANAEFNTRAAAARAEGKPMPPKPGAPQGPGHFQQPAGLYNAMIAPIVPFAIKGVIWYQGEANAGAAKAPLYRRLMETLITDWRTRWGQGDFPFLYVQLANYGLAGNAGTWPLLREAQLQTLELAHTGMAVTIDIGNPKDIHPTNKQDVGKRLALAARHAAYGEKLVYSGPVFRQSAAEGASLRLWFDHVGGGLTAHGPLEGFEIAGADGKFVPATARIEKETIVVSSPSVAAPTQARYAWADAPPSSLFNQEGLPASPFRTRP